MVPRKLMTRGLMMSSVAVIMWLGGPVQAAGCGSGGGCMMGKHPAGSHSGHGASHEKTGNGESDLHADHAPPKVDPHRQGPSKPSFNPTAVGKIPTDQLAAIAKSIDTAIQHLEAGKTYSALRELAKVKAFLGTIRVLPEKAAEKGGFINTRCPIMGSPINPEKVSGNLVRDYQGGKVAFCCAGCPAKWDKLSDTERQAKLRSANATP